ncbi:hypothetical protein G3480_06205 [Thiorhodococcus mannitoliphagus]|uniref:Uncharacterized protein n=1 Tax=Thiorhodococcus mannitoliphagus TaxID=329406 RepID=A0A6P1DSK5_9GAMM|nr:hypothetical protein [Thiorhodococcus mannitoliphagus]NEX19911.1 hypothetical protein [Thiorhodococcus mannitoliphagus]
MKKSSLAKRSEIQEDKLFIDGEDASEMLPEIERCTDLAKRTTRNNALLRKAIYYLSKAKKDNMIRLTDRQISKHISKASGCNRSLISRYLMCARLELLTGTPQGRIKESVIRVMRRVSDSLHWRVNIESALAVAGSYEKITSTIVLEVVKQNGRLKENWRDGNNRLNDHKMQQEKQSKRTGDRHWSDTVSNHSDAIRELERELKKHPEFKKILAKIDSIGSGTKWIRMYLQQSYANPDLIERVEGLDLYQRQGLLRILP